MIYYMNGKTFIKDYCTNEDPSRVLEAQYVLASNTIMKKGSNDSIWNAANVIMPSQNIVLDYNAKDYKENPAYRQAYEEQLDLNGIPIAESIVTVALDDLDRDVIILCGYHEWGYRHLHYFSKWLKKLTGMPSYNYKKKEKVEKLSKDEVKKIREKCEKIVHDHQSKELEDIMKNKNTRGKFLKSFSKKDLKKILKKAGIKSTDGLSKDEMIEIYEAFIAE